MSALTCKCQSELEAKLLDSFKAKVPEAKNHSVSLLGYGFGMTETALVLRGFMQYKATATFPLKKGDGEKQKSNYGNMIFSYCPFCGKKGESA